MVRIAELLPEQYHGSLRARWQSTGNRSDAFMNPPSWCDGSLSCVMDSSGCSSSWSPQTSSMSACTTSPDSIPISQLDGDPTRFQKALKPLDGLVSREICHARESFDADPGHHEMMARQAVRAPCPFVDIFEGVSPQILRFLGDGLLLLDLAQEQPPPGGALGPFAGNRRDRKDGVSAVCSSVVSGIEILCASGISVLLSATSIGFASRSSS